MPYRDAWAHRADRVFCPRHPAALADVVCVHCRVALCEPCVTFTGTDASCFPCARRHARRTSHAARAAFAAVVACGLGLAITGALHHRPSSGFEDTNAERCDRRATFSYERQLLGQLEFELVLADVDAYTRSCGEWIGARVSRFEALQGLGRKDEALAAVSSLVEWDPSNPEYRDWRSVQYRIMGRPEEAARDRQSACRMTRQHGEPTRFGCSSRAFVVPVDPTR